MRRLSERDEAGVPGAGGAIGTGGLSGRGAAWHGVQRLVLAGVAGTAVGLSGGFPVAVFGGVALGLVSGLGSSASAQDGMPAFVDDAPVARDTLRGLGELVARGGRAEAARALQRLLDESGSRVVATESDPDLFVAVRSAVHDRLLREPELLETYGEVFEPRARELLERGDAASVESALLLTPSGYEAALRVAQSQLERAAFDAAWRTLVQVDRHPARTATAAGSREVAALGALVLSYLPADESARAVVERWHADAGAAMPAIASVTPPAAALIEAKGPLTGGPAVDLTGIVPRPLTSVPLPAAEDAGGDGRVPSTRRGVPSAQPWALPAVVGDRVFVNDGVAISAWDRFTLRPLWRAPQELGGAGALRGTGVGQRARLVEDATAVSLAGRVLVGATGLALHSEREGDKRVHAVDRETGRVIWSVDPATLDPRLRDATVRGPVVVDGDVAVVSLRKNVRARRLISSWLVGLDLSDGSARWVTLVSSAGSLPYQQRTRRSDAVLIDRGVIYRGDEVGIVGAVESATGRPVWVRRLTGPDDSRRPGQVVAAVASPVRVGDEIALLSPGGDRLLRFEMETGEPRETVDFSAFGIFDSLLQVNGMLVLVSGERALVFDEDELGAGVAPARQVRFDGSRREVVGTASVVGDEVMVPVAAGVLFYDPARGTERLIELDVSGNAVAAEGQLVVVSLDAVHSYLVWDAASRVLMDRIEADPTDPAPPTTFAELAYRSGRFGSILDAADKAMAAAGGCGTRGRGAGRSRRCSACCCRWWRRASGSGGMRIGLGMRVGAGVGAVLRRLRVVGTR
jgi:outer membrane protein assembly factor BamB